MTARTFSMFSPIALMILVTWETVQGQPPSPALKATQSYTYGSSTADLAIDGNPNTCSLTAVNDNRETTYGWWQVDLGGVFTVYSVTVTSGYGNDSNPQYAQNFMITVDATNNTDVGDSSLCYYFNNGSYLQNGIPTTFTCSPNPLNGRYVTLKRMGGFRHDAISLCEVKIGYNNTITTTSSTTSSSSSKPLAISTRFSSLDFPVILSTLSTSAIEPLLSSTQAALSVVSTCECSSGSSASEVPAIVLGILFALSLAVIIGLVIYIVRLKRSSTSNICIKTTEFNSNDQDNHNYEKLGNKSTATVSQANAREIPHPPPVTSLFNAQDGSPYETVAESNC